ncbi:MAG: ABC transporter permease [Pyrinomonadaceae bacterium]
MRKFFAVLRHEYRKIVLKWTFLVGTLVFPLLAACFALVPALIFSMKGDETRIVIVDQAGQVRPRLMANLSGDRVAEKARKAMDASMRDMSASQQERMQTNAAMLAAGFDFVDYDPAGKSSDEIRRDLNAKAGRDEIDAYLIVPEDIAAMGSKFEFRSRKAGDFVANDTLRDALNEAVRSERLAGANIDEALLQNLSRNVDLDSKSISDQGEEKDSDMLFIASLIIGMLIYVTLTIYGQVIMAAVVEEKETRIAEILFSSAAPFTLLFGKLVGVGLAGLTQIAIWVGSLAVILTLLATQADLAPLLGSLPDISPLMVLYFFIYFIVGYFIYASIFALIGAMVTTTQEGGQFAFPPIMIMLIGFYFCFAVIRDPNSSLSFWVSIAPLFAPLTMPVRILAEMPPFWHIALSIALNVATIAALVWVAARAYRIGMLMYGKRATIPQVLKWIRQP